MNLRVSLIVLIVGSWVAVGAAWIVDSGIGEEDSTPQPPFFYNVPVEDILNISLEHEGNVVSFHFRESIRRWYFDDTEELVEIPADPFRFGGITTLLGGPRTARVLEANIVDPAQYGLDNPVSRYSIGLRNGDERVLLIGNPTVDGGATYARIEGFPQLVLVDSSWSGVLDRLVDEPPVPEWLYILNPDEAREILLFEGNEVVRGYGFDRDTNNFYLCDIPIQDEPCTGTVPVDEGEFQSALDHIAARKINGAVALGVSDDSDLTIYGADRNAPYMAIRTERRDPQSSVTEVNRVTMTIGDTTQDGEFRFAVVNETSDVILVDRVWADQVLELFDGEPLTGP